ncbi:unnamed protein product [Amoebophrya sp. A120]|nr:unnamed protein product [Amoebophrya sp. A120]|eukprot:GSA120T00010461001.1
MSAEHHHHHHHHHHKKESKGGEPGTPPPEGVPGTTTDAAAADPEPAPAKQFATIYESTFLEDMFACCIGEPKPLYNKIIGRGILGTPVNAATQGFMDRELFGEDTQQQALEQILDEEGLHIAHSIDQHPDESSEHPSLPKRPSRLGVSVAERVGEMQKSPRPNPTKDRNSSSEEEGSPGQ